jgi:DNA (cytosine-5)-methyltransferase 1
MEYGAEIMEQTDRGIVLRALGAVLGDLADIGYDCKWSGVRASEAGAPHQRFRVFIVAHPNGK